MLLRALLFASMVADSPFRPLPEQQSGNGSGAAPTEGATGTEEGVARLPFAQGRRFATLDSYLAHLKTQSAIDLPWWREISPGVYEHVRHMPGAARETATREELMKRFGFAR